MPAVALIGPDGSGKTTLTRMLEQSGILPFRYLYMGVDIPAGTMALPTSRLAGSLKARGAPERGRFGPTRQDGVPQPQGGARPQGGIGPVPAVSHHDPPGTRGGMLRGMARLANRMAEQWFRQCLSWYYQARGYVVLYDRHYVLDFSPEIIGAADARFDRRLHQWQLRHLYPYPDLVIFLDAPGELLFARKGESSAQELERRRQGFLRAGERLPNFVRVDATQPLPDVYAEVTRHVLGFCRGRRTRSGQVAP